MLLAIEMLMRSQLGEATSEGVWYDAEIKLHVRIRRLRGEVSTGHTASVGMWLSRRTRC